MNATYSDRIRNVLLFSLEIIHFLDLLNLNHLKNHVGDELLPECMHAMCVRLGNTIVPLAFTPVDYLPSSSGLHVCMHVLSRLHS